MDGLGAHGCYATCNALSLNRFLGKEEISSVKNRIFSCFGIGGDLLFIDSFVLFFVNKKSIFFGHDNGTEMDVIGGMTSSDGQILMGYAYYLFFVEV